MWLSSVPNYDPSQKQYLLRAIHSWIEDNHLTAHLVIAFPNKGWTSGVPQHLLEDKTLVLNISTLATRNLAFHEESLSFNTRFSGKDHEILVDYEAIVALIARENQQGIQFNVDEKKLANPPERKEKTAPTSGNPFKVIK